MTNAAKGRDKKSITIFAGCKETYMIDLKHHIDAALAAKREGHSHHSVSDCARM